MGNNVVQTVLRYLTRKLSSPSQGSRRRGLAVLLPLLLLPGLWGCDDDPFKIRWQADPDTVQLYALSRPELNLYSAFDFVRRVPIRIEAPSTAGDWDLAVDTREGDLVLLPPGALGVDSRARIAVMAGMTFDEVTRAPSDSTAYVSDEPVPFTFGNTYVIRTRQEAGSFGRRCVYYGKLEPVAKDTELGSATFVYDVSPVCNSRKLLPPKD